jgi:acyl carrier protein
MSDLHTRLTAVFRSALDDESLVLSPDLTANDVATWNSLSHIDLIVAVEKEFRIRFTTAEVSGLKNVGEMEALIGAKLTRAERS